MIARRLIAWLALMGALWLGASAPAAGAGEGGEPLGLLECIQLAGQASYQHWGLDGERDAAQEEQEANERRFLPSLRLDLVQQPKVDYFGRPVEERDTYLSELRLTQPLYNPALPLGRDRALLDLDRIKLARHQVRVEAGLEVVGAYYALLAARRKAALRQELVPLARELAARVRQGVDQGLQRREDWLAAQARYLEASYDHAQGLSQAREEAGKLKALVGLPRAQRLELKAQEPANQPLPDARRAVAQALRDSPLVLAAQAQERLSETELRLAQERQGPRLDLEWRYGVEGDDFPGEEKSVLVMVKYQMTFGETGASAFYGWEHQFANPASFYYEQMDLQRKGISLNWLGEDTPTVTLARARARRLAAKGELRRRRLELRMRVAGLWEEYQRNQALLELAQGQVALGQERVQVARAKSDQGGLTPGERLDRELELARARDKEAEAVCQRARVVASLCLLSGRPLQLKEMP